MNKIFFNYLFLLSFSLILFSCSGDKIESSEKKIEKNTSKIDKSKLINFTVDQYKLSDIEVGSIELRNLSDILKLTGTIEAQPNSVATVSAPLGGYIKSSGLLLGQFVKKGEHLVTIENPEFIKIQQEYLESNAKFEYLSQEYLRQQELRNSDVNSSKTFQQISSEFNILKARVSGLEQILAIISINAESLKKHKKISRTVNIYAPISGYIKTSNVNIGKYITPTDAIFEIAGIDGLHLELNAFEKDYGKIKIGQAVKFSMSNEQDYNHTGKVFLIGKSANEQKTFPIHCHFKSIKNIAPGMYVKAWVETSSEKTTAVPLDAIVQFEGLDHIVVQTAEDKNGFTFQLLQIARSREQDGYIAVKLPSNMNYSKIKIVTKNAYTILSAMKNAQEE